MGIVPPDPGNALQLAHDCEHDPALLAFTREGPRGEPLHRWLVPDGGAWRASFLQERLVRRSTYDLLRAGVQATEDPRFFYSGGARYALVDDGFEARAEEV